MRLTTLPSKWKNWSYPKCHDWLTGTCLVKVSMFLPIIDAHWTYSTSRTARKFREPIRLEYLEEDYLCVFIFLDLSFCLYIILNPSFCCWCFLNYKGCDFDVIAAFICPLLLVLYLIDSPFQSFNRFFVSIQISFILFDFTSYIT